MSVTSNSNRFIAPEHWQVSLLSTNPIFNDLCQLFPLLTQPQWPEPALLNQWRRLKDYSFIENSALLADGRYYESYIADSRQIPCREQNWHDLFGALIWCLFPQTKALINQLHQAEILREGNKTRTVLRNKLTLLDECGVIIACEPDAIAHQTWLRQHQWQQSFIQQRQDWWQHIRPLIFGHAMYEMATKPFLGLTAKCWFIEVPSGFSQWSLTDAYIFIDQKLCQQIANGAAVLDNQQLSPLPLLGVPGWYPDNQQQAFYENTGYFRPKRAGK
ncbi:DUF3025 domain-containing protein [Arsukibacterium sp.]|uniref:DUF3025 domain-containing protein n=1 Tax=Arsukibacterium sp. TaxID=1977258 RepID=UPI002FD87FE9